MLSLEQIKSVTFDRIVRGYRPEDVDDFIIQVAQQLEKLMAENKELENNINILADSIEGYRADEEALKAALINAQRLGEKVIKEANQKAEQILKEGKVKADRDFDIAMEKVHAEHIRLTRMQQEVAIFRSTVIEAYKKHIGLLSNLPIDKNEEHIPVNYFEDQDREFSERQKADMQEAKPTLTEPQDHMFEPPVAQQFAMEPPTAAPTPAPAPVPLFNSLDQQPLPPFVGETQEISFDGFEQSLRQRDSASALTEKEIERAAANRTAANATSEFGPIIPVVDEEDEQPMQAPNPNERIRPVAEPAAPSGKISIFDRNDNIRFD